MVVIWVSDTNKDELIKAQKQVIGILFEIIKRLQANNDLDEEYFRVVASKNSKPTKNRLDEILKERHKNSEIVHRLLKQLEV